MPLKPISTLCEHHAVHVKVNNIVNWTGFLLCAQTWQLEKLVRSSPSCLDKRGLSQSLAKSCLTQIFSDRRRGGWILEERWLNGSAPDCKSVVLGSNAAPSQHMANSISPEVGSHLGWHTMCWPLRGGRGTQYTQKPLKIYRKKQIFSEKLKDWLQSWTQEQQCI